MDLPFHVEELINVDQSLHCRLCVVVLLSLWDGIDKIPSDMRPTGCSRTVFEFIVSAVPIGHQETVESFKEFPGCITCPCFGVMEQDYLFPVKLTGTEYPHEGFCLGSAARFFKYLHRCFVSH